MLFDIRGKRKRVIQVIYAFLALLLAVGLVGLGIGGDANGGIFDALGIGGNGSSGGDSQIDSEIDKAKSTLETDPENQAALLSLARNSYLAGQQQIEVDDQGNQSLGEDSLNDFAAATSAWEQYLATKPKKPDDSVAGLIFQAYGAQAQFETDPVLIKRLLEGAERSATIVAEARPSPNSWLQAAQYAYYNGNDKAAEKAGKQAVAEANEADRSAVKAQLKQFEKQGKAVQAQLKAQSQQTDPEQSLENPLGGLGGTSTTPAPAPSGGGGSGG